METLKLKEIKKIIIGQTMSKTFRKNENYDWGTLLLSIKKEGFLPEKYGYIIVSKDNYCLDGYHRHTILKELYGENYEVKVIKTKLNYIPEVLSKLFFYLFVIKPVRLFNKNFKK